MGLNVGNSKVGYGECNDGGVDDGEEVGALKGLKVGDEVGRVVGVLVGV